MKYGWKPDKPDFRDYKYASEFLFKAAFRPSLPERVDLRPSCPQVYYQGDLGSCTANALAGALEFDYMKQSKDMMPSRLFIYYNERDLEGTISSDNGAELRDGLKTLVKYGACPESEWPYNILQFKDEPSEKCYLDAKQFKIVQYSRLEQNKHDLCYCLSTGYPFVFGFTVYESFESNKVAHTGIVPLPSRAERVVGGHAVMAVGYDISQDIVIVRNSWGKDWGQQGYFMMPFDYILNSNLAEDFWTIKG